MRFLRDYMVDFRRPGHKCPKNTAKSNEWAIRNFHACQVARNEQHGPDNQCPEDVFDSKSKACD